MNVRQAIFEAMKRSFESDPTEAPWLCLAVIAWSLGGAAVATAVHPFTKEWLRGGVPGYSSSKK